MKKTILSLFYILAVLGVFVSCEDENDEVTPTYGDAELVSFGFYAEDNEGNLFNDYVVDNITNEISIALPDYVDKSSLVARFEVTEDDSIKVNGVAQVSGESVNDFTSPVDYIVSEGTNNSMYTVSVEDLPDAVWTNVASDTTEMRETVLKVNPVTNLPYIAFVQSADDYDSRFAGVLTLEDNQLVRLGGGTASEGRAADVSLAFDLEGVPYISFADYTNENTGASVMSYSGSSWSYPGGEVSKGITDTEIGFNDAVFAANDEMFLFAVNDGRDGAIARRNLNISKFDGSSWQTSMTMPGRPEANTYYPIAKRSGSSVYLGVLNASLGTFSVYKNTEGSWTTIVEGHRDENATGIYYRDFDMDVDKDGNVYIAIGDDATGADLVRPKVMKYDAESGTWSNLGSAIAVDFTSTRELSLAVSPAGIPYLLYRNESSFPEVVYFDDETQDWTSPIVLAELESSDLKIAFAPNGVGYAIFTSTNNDDTVLFKYDIPAE